MPRNRQRAGTWPHDGCAAKKEAVTETVAAFAANGKRRTVLDHAALRGLFFPGIGYVDGAFGAVHGETDDGVDNVGEGFFHGVFVRPEEVAEHP